MAEQLALLERDESDFRIDEHTREIGRRGVAEARRVLAEVVRAAAERAEREQTDSGAHDGPGYRHASGERRVAA